MVGQNTQKNVDNLKQYKYEAKRRSKSATDEANSRVSAKEKTDSISAGH